MKIKAAIEAIHKEIFYFKSRDVEGTLSPSKYIQSQRPASMVREIFSQYYRGVRDKCERGEMTREELQEEIDYLQQWGYHLSHIYYDRDGVSQENFGLPVLDWQPGPMVFTNRSFSLFFERAYSFSLSLSTKLRNIREAYLNGLELLGLEGDKEEVTNRLFEDSQEGVERIKDAFVWKSTTEGFLFWADLYLNRQDDEFLRRFRQILMKINPKLKRRLVSDASNNKEKYVMSRNHTITTTSTTWVNETLDVWSNTAG